MGRASLSEHAKAPLPSAEGMKPSLKVCSVCCVWLQANIKLPRGRRVLQLGSIQIVYLAYVTAADRCARVHD